MSIFKYKVINPVKNNKMPFFDEKKGIFYIPLYGKYRYFVECVLPQEDGDIKYYILLSEVKFDKNCRLCHTDAYGRVQVKIRGIFKDFILSETKERGNVTVEYTETIGDYDVFHIV